MLARPIGLILMEKLLRNDKIKLVNCTAHGDVQKTTFLLNVFGTAKWYATVHDAEDPYHLPLASLGRVDGGKHRVVFLLRLPECHFRLCRADQG